MLMVTSNPRDGFLLPTWRGCYWHPELRMFLIVYVDDFKMAGPKELLPKAWQLLRKGIIMDNPTDYGLFLGCKHIIHEVSIKVCPRTVKLIEYEVEGCLDQAV